MRLRVGRTVAGTLAALYMVFLAGYLIQRPDYDWDDFPYLAIALSYGGTAGGLLHEQAYGIMRDTVPKATMDSLTGIVTSESLAATSSTTTIGDPVFRQEMARDSEKFLAQLPFFSVKPIYPALMAVGHLCGLDLMTSGFLVSVLAYVGIGIVLYLWFSEWMPSFVALSIMALLVINPWLVIIARRLGPDILSIFALMLGGYLAFGYDDYNSPQKLAGRPLAASIVFLVAIAIRPENALYALLLVLYLWIGRSLTITPAAFLMVGAFVIYFGITMIFGHYGWHTLFYFSFVNKSAALSDGQPHLGWLDYMNFYLGRLDRILMGQGELPIFALVGLGGLLLKFGLKPLRDKYVHLILLSGIIGAIRIIVLPTEAYRALLPCYMFVTIAFIEACTVCKGTVKMTVDT